jgi:hypothetical protein
MREAPQNETGRPDEMEMPNAQVFCHKIEKKKRKKSLAGVN